MIPQLCPMELISEMDRCGVKEDKKEEKVKESEGRVHMTHRHQTS